MQNEARLGETTEREIDEYKRSVNKKMKETNSLVDVEEPLINIFSRYILSDCKISINRCDCE